MADANSYPYTERAKAVLTFAIDTFLSVGYIDFR